jgi:hypothetical protein
MSPAVSTATIALGAATSALVGAFASRLAAGRRARNRYLCPVCLAPTDAGGVWCRDATDAERAGDD